MPDIDIDFCFERRQEVIDYVVEKYGKDRVAQIITLEPWLQERLYGMWEEPLTYPMERLMPCQNDTFSDWHEYRKAMELNPELRQRYNDDERVKELIDTAKLLEGMPRHASTHAAGVVISREPLTEYVPFKGVRTVSRLNFHGNFGGTGTSQDGLSGT